MKLYEIRMRDPFVLPDGGKYYLYGTVKRRVSGTSVYMPVYVSDNLTDWREEEAVFTLPEDFWGTRCFWAPDVFYYCGKYYIFITLDGDGHKRGTQIFVGNGPVGEFIPLTDKAVTPSNKQCLDASLYYEDGEPYLIYSLEWLEEGSGKIAIAKLSQDLTHITGEEHILLDARKTGISSVVHGVYNGVKVNGYVTDSPLIYKSGNGKYILFWSTFYNDSYCIAVAESDTLTGKYIQKNVLYTNDGGHSMLFRAYDGNTYISFHAPNSNTEHPVFMKVTEENGAFKLI